jgi:ADP-heptose:LPS heptosyltransferase
VTGGKVLVVQLARLGDLVQTWPLLRRLRHEEPGWQLDILADHQLKALHTLGPDLDYIWEADLAKLPSLAKRDLPEAYDRLRFLVESFKGREYDLVYNLNFSRLSLLLSYMAGRNVRGYRPVKGGRDFLREPWLALVYALVHARQVNRVHLSDVFRHLAPAMDFEPRPMAPVVRPGEPIIALQVATRHPKRTWPLEAFSRLAGLLVNRLGARVWLVGTRAEFPLGEALIEGLTLAQRERVVNLQGRTDLLELAARLREVHLLVSGDTGTLHLAAALGTRTLGVFLGPASCFETGPYGEGHYVFQAEPPCHPCAEAGSACPEPICQAMIPPEAVADLAVSLCTRGEPPSPPPLPAGTRLYRSVFDPLGMTYAPLGARYRFIDLLGQAYRRAGAQLLGLSWPLSQPHAIALCEDDWQNLERLAAAVKNGGRSGISPPLATFLAPLQAYREELQRQKALGRDEIEAEACLATVEQGFRAGLEELAAAG